MSDKAILAVCAKGETSEYVAEALRRLEFEAFNLAGGAENFLLGLFGVGIAAVGMLSTLGITLATDAYGPIADNAGGNAEMTNQPAFVRDRTEKLLAIVKGGEFEKDALG